MPIIAIDEVFSVSGALQADDIENLKQEGVTTLICTRFDGEESEQLPSTYFAEVAESSGLEHFHVPVKSGQYETQDVALFWQAFANAKGKVHGYCRTGTRASHLWAIGQIKNGAEKPAILDKLHNHGINTSAISD